MNIDFLFKESKHFCVLPWIHLHGSVDGVWGRCCMDNSTFYNDYYNQKERPVFKLQSDSIGCISESEFAKDNNEKVFGLVDAFNSPSMKATRKKMLRNECVNSCVSCVKLEENGGTSYRMKSNARFYKQYNWEAIFNNTSVDGYLQGVLSYLDIRFGNLCNLKCTMCSFPASSKWADKDAWYPSKINPYINNKKFWEDLKIISSKLNRIYFAGGEPFLAEGHFNVLNFLIENNLASNIELVYTTNLTLFNDQIGDLLDQFKSIELGCSFDGIGQLFEQIRTGAKWKVFCENLEKVKIKKYKVLLLVTVQRSNLSQLPEMIKWGIANDCIIDLTNVLQFPPKFSISGMSKGEKQEHKKNLENFCSELDDSTQNYLIKQIRDLIKILEA